MYSKCYNKCCKNGALLEAKPKMENCVSTAPVRTNQRSSPPENHTKQKKLNLRTNTLRILFFVEEVSKNIRKVSPFGTFF